MKIVGLILAVLVATFLVLLFFIQPFLSIHEPHTSSNLVIESWLNGPELESIIEMSEPLSPQKIYIVGPYFDNDISVDFNSDKYEKKTFFKWRNKKGVLLLANSSVIINLSKLNLRETDSLQSITVFASDTQKNKIFAHFSVALNGKLLGSSFVNDSLKEYTYFVGEKKKENQYLAISFNNDYYSGEESRNLYIESIEVNGAKIYLEESNSFITRQENLYTTGFCSEAQQVADYIKSLNVEPGTIEIVEFHSRKRNQTLEAAKSLNDYLGEKKLQHFNVSSAGLHGRRTLLVYRNVLENDKVGIFNVELENFKKNNWYKSKIGILKMLDELGSYIYVYLYLSFS